MTAIFGPAGLILIAFLGAMASLMGLYGLHALVRGAAPARH